MNIFAKAIAAVALLSVVIPHTAFADGDRRDGQALGIASTARFSTPNPLRNGPRRPGREFAAKIFGSVITGRVHTYFAGTRARTSRETFEPTVIAPPAK